MRPQTGTGRDLTEVDQKNGLSRYLIDGSTDKRRSFIHR
jgi:hypothetical protein